MLRRRDRSVQVTDEDLKKLEILLELVGEQSKPNFNALLARLRDVPLMAMNLKTFGYDIARRLAAELPVREGTQARHVGLSCKASTQADLESDWAAHWCAQLHTPVVFHRKLWELSYVLQAVYENGFLRVGTRGLGFGCGEEPLASYFASHGAEITVTDLAPDKAEAKGWADSHQHVASLDKAYQSKFLERAEFERLVKLEWVDMNAIPDHLQGYDFCWSMCALEHLGSIRQGLDFIENSLKTLRSGGVAVHTTEFNINPTGPTVDNWPCVLFQRHHFEDLAAKLQAQGHRVASFDFDFGDKPMDRFVDMPPYSYDLPPAMVDFYGPGMHMKLSIDGFPCTCFGIIVQKA